MNLPEKLLTLPAFTASDWAGYFHFQDPTIQPFNTLTYPSINCSMPRSDKVVPDKGKTLLGQGFTQNVGIIGNKEKFTTMGGIELEVRVFASEQYLEYSTLVGGPFAIGETVTGGSSGATAVVESRDTGKLIFSSVVGTFTVGETITGGTSGATAVVTIEHTTYKDEIQVLYTDTNPSGAFYNIPHWYQITQNVNPLTQGLHRYSFDQWFDTNLNPSASLNLPRLIWVNGLAQIFSWTGGVAPIVSFVLNTSITTTAGVSWASLGFVSPALGGSGNIIINGVAYAITGGWNTDTLTLASTTGITAGNLAFSQIETDATTTPIDFCRQTQNYMFYGEWKSRKLQMSNAFNRPAVQDIINVQAIQNDLVVNQASPYTGLTSKTYRVTIDSVNPEINTTSFNGGGLNDAIWNTSSYSGSAGVHNEYKISIVGDMTMFLNTVVGSFPVGAVIQGGTSQAEAVIVSTFTFSGVAGLGLRMLTSTTFQAGEALTNITDGTSTANVTSNAAQNWYTGTKNGTTFTTGGTYGTLSVNGIFSNGPITLPDGLVIRFANFDGHFIGDTFTLNINIGGADTFQWQIDGATPSATGVAITGGFQTLSDGVQIQFVSKTGHTKGDFWDIRVYPAVTEAWHNFYYSLPSRRPGEGYIFTLPSNFWTMDVQEDKMYVNTQFGEWSTITSELSSDLLSEKLTLEPLKQAGALKVIDPWMTGHLEDDLMFVTLDKSLMSLGRKQFLQEPQDGYISDAVKFDFLPCSFVGGSIKYIGKRLYISSPEQHIMHCYDVAQGYWQPPKTFSEVGILSIVLNQLITHSNTRNQSFTMFTNVSDNDMEYLVVMRTPYSSVGGRWKSKFSSNSFTEGYIEGAPKLIHTVYSGVNGCGIVASHPVEPILCVAPDRSPLGEGPFGSHALGSDVSIQGNYFNEIFTKYKPVLSYYFIALEISCISKNHSYSILSLGMNGTYSPGGNNTLVNRDITNL